ncbi:unnamed protein product, partial [Didymodactylos carnosus]
IESTNSTDEVFNTFNNVMAGKDDYSLSEWAENTSKLGDKLYFLYFGALALIYDHLQDPMKNKENLFIKIGVGQGKSLTIAETARKIIQMNRNFSRTKQEVFIIACYDHLAKRDFENYQSYYRHFGIQSMYCSSGSSTKDFSDQDVIYPDLETYFGILRKNGFDTLTKSGRIDISDTSDAVLIMDEFDSLILDSHHIFQKVVYFELN